jgi:TonB family protein
MNLETRSVPAGARSFLNGCIVAGDPAQQHAAQQAHRKAILLSVTLQVVAVASLIVFPLLGKSERVPVRIIIERPPYRLGSDRPNAGVEPRPAPLSTLPCLFCKHTESSGKPLIQGISTTDPGTADDPNGPSGAPDGVPTGIEPPLHTPRLPVEDPTVEEKRDRVTIGHIDPAHLTRRIEPRYPTMGVQLRRETRVELQAIIARDGSIQSLQVLSGDPLFYQSALEAVREWRYTPTYLNGLAVEVDTHITVIYSLNR